MNTSNKLGSAKFPWIKLLEMRFPSEYFHCEPFFKQLFSGEPRGTIFFENYLLEKWMLLVGIRVIK
jgi:hypothetical protein